MLLRTASAINKSILYESDRLRNALSAHRETSKKDIRCRFVRWFRFGGCGDFIQFARCTVDKHNTSIVPTNVAHKIQKNIVRHRSHGFEIENATKPNRAAQERKKKIKKKKKLNKIKKHKFQLTFTPFWLLKSVLKHCTAMFI